jgi:hypothetical protein
MTSPVGELGAVKPFGGLAGDFPDLLKMFAYRDSRLVAMRETEVVLGVVDQASLDTSKKFAISPSAAET